MSAPTGIRSGVGFRNCVVFPLTAAGLPEPGAAAAAAYEGIHVSGAKVLTINEPEPRRISHIGDDTVLTLDFLPPTEAASAELHSGKVNDILDAAIGGMKAFTVGEFAMLGVATDQRGYEPQVGLLAYRQAQDTDPASATFGLRTWDFRLMPKAWLYARDAGYNDQPEDRVYTVTPAYCTAHLWGTAFSTSTEGMLRSQMLRGVSFGKPKLVAWKGDNSRVAFNLPTTAPAVSTDKMTVWVNGTLQTSGLTKTTTSLTFTAAPATNAIVVCFYEA